MAEKMKIKCFDCGDTGTHDEHCPLRDYFPTLVELDDHDFVVRVWFRDGTSRSSNSRRPLVFKNDNEALFARGRTMIKCGDPLCTQFYQSKREEELGVLKTAEAADLFREAAMQAATETRGRAHSDRHRSRERRGSKPRRRDRRSTSRDRQDNTQVAGAPANRGASFALAGSGVNGLRMFSGQMPGPRMTGPALATGPQNVSGQSGSSNNAGPNNAGSNNAGLNNPGPANPGPANTSASLQDLQELRTCLQKDVQDICRETFATIRLPNPEFNPRWQPGGTNRALNFPPPPFGPQIRHSTPTWNQDTPPQQFQQYQPANFNTYTGEPLATPLNQTTTASTHHATSGSEALLKALITKTEKFHGYCEKEKFPTWLSNVETFFRLTKNEDEAKQFVLTVAEDDAHETIYEMIHHPWAEMKAKLISRYDPLGGETGAYQAWTSLKQANKSIIEHNAHVLRIFRWTNSTTNTINKGWNMNYVDSLRVYAHRRSLSKFVDNKTLAELMAKAEDLFKADEFASRGETAPTPQAVDAAAIIPVVQDQMAAVFSAHEEAWEAQGMDVSVAAYQQRNFTPRNGQQGNSAPYSAKTMPPPRKPQPGKPFCVIHESIGHSNEECSRKSDTTCVYCKTAVQPGGIFKHMETCKGSRCFKCGRRGHQARFCGTPRVPPFNNNAERTTPSDAGPSKKARVNAVETDAEPDASTGQETDME